jgi:hypothetical protein
MLNTDIDTDRVLSCVMLKDGVVFVSAYHYITRIKF